MDERTKFNQAYWAAQPPDVQKLNKMDSFSDERTALAIDLATKGHVIDHQIQALGVSAYETMRLREMYGYTWVPSLLMQPIKIAPGIVIPMAPRADHYDPDAYPSGCIIVSADVEDYQPYPTAAPAVPPAPVAEIHPVGMQISATYFLMLSDGLAFGHGDTWTGISTMGVAGTWRMLLLAAGGFGSHRVWEKIA